MVVIIMYFYIVCSYMPLYQHYEKDSDGLCSRSKLKKARRRVLGDLSLRVKEITDLLDILTVGSYLPAVLKCLDMFKLVCATTAEISKLNEALENVRAGRGEIKVGVLTVEIKRILRNLTGEHLRFFDVLVHCEPLVDFLRKQVRFSE